MFFFGWTITSTFVPYLSDKYGRKWPLFISIAFQCVLQSLMLLSGSIHVTIAIYFFIGMCAAGRVAISTTYLNELVLEKKRTLVTTILNISDAFSMIYQVIYYAINRNIYPLHWFLFGVNCFITLSLLLLPESPKWCYARNKFDDARKGLYKIAYFNKSENLH